MMLHPIVKLMRLGESFFARLYPELECCEDVVARHKAIQYATRKLYFSLPFIIVVCFLSALVMIADIFLLTHTTTKSSWLYTSCSYVIGGLGIPAATGIIPLLLFRQRGRILLRNELHQWGTPICLHCGYNMRGNTSMRCPECGTGFKAVPSKQALSSRRLSVTSCRIKRDSYLVRLYPELANFANDADRGAAWRFVRHHHHFIPLLIVALFLSLLVVGQITYITNLAHLSGWILLGGYLTAVLFVPYFFLLLRFKMRNTLRLELRDQGIPICLYCGYDMQGDISSKCPKCGTDFEPMLSE